MLAGSRSRRRHPPPTRGGTPGMAIDFTLSNDQRELQATAREFAETVLAPVVREADAEPDPLRGFQRTKDAYVEAYKAGIAFCMIPSEYGGGGPGERAFVHAPRG